MNQISERVQEELDEASAHLRNALSFAARTEKPAIIKNLSLILQSIEELPTYDKQIELLQSLQTKFIKQIENNGDSTTI